MSPKREIPFNYVNIARAVKDYSGGETNIAMFPDSDDIWVGMYGSLSLVNSSNDRHIPVSERFPQMIKGVHNSITEDAHGNIWDATSNGIFIISSDVDSCRRLTPNEGISDINVSTVIFDGDDNAWISTYGGLDRVSPSLDITHIHGRNDMSGSEYFSAIKSADNKKLLFSGERGITIIEPEKIKKPEHDYNIFISGIYLNGKKINNTSLTSSGEKVLPMGSTDPSKIRLSFRDNSLMFRMSTKNFWDTDNLVFQWRIPDIVNNWVSTTPGSGIIALPHLPSGSYRLEVRATENGLFSDIKTVTISVSSPWYLSPVAKLGGVNVLKSKCLTQVLVSTKRTSTGCLTVSIKASSIMETFHSDSESDLTYAVNSWNFTTESSPQQTAQIARVAVSPCAYPSDAQVPTRLLQKKYNHQ